MNTYSGSGARPYGESSDETYRCPHCQFIGRATVYVMRGEWSTSCDVTCADCEALLHETDDIFTGHRCDRCSRAEAMPNDDLCYTCAIAIDLDDVRALELAAPCVKLTPLMSHEIDTFIRDITRDQLALRGGV